jgi:dethiobiotin synthetase
LLTAESIAHRNLPWAGWVGNQIATPAMACQTANLDTLRARLPAPCLGVQGFSAAPIQDADALGWLTLPSTLVS